MYHSVIVTMSKDLTALARNGEPVEGEHPLCLACLVELVEGKLPPEALALTSRLAPYIKHGVVPITVLTLVSTNLLAGSRSSQPSLHEIRSVLSESSAKVIPALMLTTSIPATAVEKTLLKTFAEHVIDVILRGRSPIGMPQGNGQSLGEAEECL